MQQLLYRTVKGSPLTNLEVDSNFRKLRGAVNALEAAFVPLPSVIPTTMGGTGVNQTLVNNRVMISSAGTIIENAAITANRALISNETGLPIHSTVTSTELAQLSGISTSQTIQSQINDKYTTPTGTTSQYIRGDGSISTFPTGLPPSGSAGGDLTGTYPNPVIGSNKVTLAKFQQVATATILGRSLSGTGNIEVLTSLPFTIGVSSGGTGITSYAVGDLIYASGVTTLSKLSAGTAGQVLVTQGTGMAPVWSGATGIGAAGSDTQVQYNNAGFFGASADFTFNNSTKRFSLPNSSATVLIGNGSFIGDVSLAKSSNIGGVGYYVKNAGSAGVSDSYFQANNSDNTQSVALVAKNTASGENAYVGTKSASTFEARANDTPYITLLTTGKVGINNQSPAELLSLGTTGTTAGVMSFAGGTTGKVIVQVAAAAGSWSMTLPTTAGTNNYVLTTNGSGVTTWAQVSASVITGVLPYANGGTNTSTSFTQNSIIFAGATGFAENNSNLNWNDSTTTFSVNGVVLKSDAVTLNTQFGNSSLASLTSGTSNAVYGYQAGMAITSGTLNVLMGHQAGLALTTTSGNTLIGDQAGSAYIGQNSVYIGLQAGMGAAGFNGNTNVAVGAGAGSAGTTFASSVFVGGSAGRFDTTGGFNTLIGENAGRNNQTGAQNTILGARAGSGNSFGGSSTGNSFSNNTMVGYQSGLNGTTGSNNVFLGHLSGGNLTTGTANIAIGYQVNIQSATANNQMTIGNAIYGTTIDGIGGTVSTGNIGFFNNAPAEMFSLGRAGRTGVMAFYGTTSGKVTLQAASVAGTPTFTLPTTIGSANTVMTDNGSGVLSFAQVSLTAGVTGVLPVANGGTATSTAFTTGSVVFAGASGTYTQNNSSFFWDNSNVKLSVGVNTGIVGDINLSKSNTGAGVGYYVKNTGANALSDAYFQAVNADASQTVNLVAKNAAASANAWVGTSSNTAFGIRTNNTEYVTIRSTGEMGVGATPLVGAKLYVRDTSATVVYVTTADTTSGTASMTFDSYASSVNILSSVGNSGSTFVVGTATNHRMDIRTNGVERIVMLGAGQIALGISPSTSPTAYLHLAAGTAAASTAPLKFTLGTAQTTGETGAMEYSTIAGTAVLTFVRAGTTREGVLTGNLATGETNVVDTTRSFHVINQATGATLRIPVCV